MVSTTSSSSSSSPSSSFSSFDSGLTAAKSTVKFVCSYGGTILPRYPDGKLRYAGGETRVLAVDRSLPFSELQLKLEELSGYRFCKLRCQLRHKDLDDALISVSSDDDLANLYEEFDVVGTGSSFKIKGFLFPLRAKPPRPPVRRPTANGHQQRCCCCIHQPQRAAAVYQRPHGYHHQQQQQQMYLVHHGNHRH